MPTFPLGVVFQGIDRITGPARRMTANVGASLRRVSGRLGLPVVADKLGRLGKALGGIGRQAVQVGRRFGLLGTLAVGALVGVVATTANAGDQIAKAADRVGLGIEAYQELAFAADRSGVSTSLFASSMVALAKRTGELKAGTGGLFNILKKTDKALLAQIERAETTEEAFDLVVGKLAETENATEKAALAAAAFSRSGVVMVNVANNGAEGLDELRRRARELGLVMSEDAARGSELFVDAQTDMVASIKGIGFAIGSELMPVLTQLTNQFTTLVLENRPAIQAWAKTFAAGLPAKLKQLQAELVGLRERFQPLISLAMSAVDQFGAVKIGIGALATVILVSMVPSLIAGTKAVWGLTTALLANPIGWVIALVGGLVLAAVKLWQHWDKVADFFIGFWDGMKRVFVAGIDWILDKVNLLIDWLPDWAKGIFGVDSTPRPPARLEVSLSGDRAAAARRGGGGDPFAPPDGGRQAQLRVRFEDVPPGVAIADVDDPDGLLELQVGNALGGI